MQNLTHFPFCVSRITIDKVHWFLDLFDELDITVWIDGGWGVDALLGEWTREHQDLDIMISWEDSAILTAVPYCRRNSALSCLLSRLTFSKTVMP